jgi:hypothetical protein
MPIQVSMPDGTTAVFPDNTKPEVIERVKREKAAAMQRREQPQEAPGMLQTAIRAFGQGVTYGGSDEATAGIEAALGRMPYSQSLEEQRREQEAMRRANPLTYAAAEFGGAMLSPNPLGKAGAVTSTGARLLREAGVSGGIGAVQGALEAEPGNRLQNAAQMGAISSVVGPAAGAAMDFARGARSVMGRAFRPDEPRVASQEVLGAMREAGVTGDQLRQQILTGRPDEIRPFGMMMGQSGQMAAERAAIGGGKAGDIARETSQNILSESGARVMSVVNEMTGGNRQFTQDILKKFEEARNKNATELYGKARAVGIVQDDDIVNIIAGDPLLRSLYKKAQVNAQRQEGMKLPDIVDKDGNLIQNAYPSVAALDYLLRAVRTKKDQAFRNGDVNASGIKALFDQLDSKVKDLVPEYRTARARFTEDSELIKLSELGQKFINMSESDRKVALRALDPDKLEVVRGTARDALYNRLATMDDAGMARMLTGSKQNRDLLEFLAVSPEAAAQAALRIRQERQLQEFARNINPNIGSRTARTSAAAGAGVDQLARTEQVTEFVMGNNASKFMTLLNLAGGRLRGLTPNVREDMARMLTTISPQDQLRILERLDLEDQRLLREAVERSNKRTKSVQRGARIPGLLSAEEQEQ